MACVSAAAQDSTTRSNWAAACGDTSLSVDADFISAGLSMHVSGAVGVFENLFEQPARFNVAFAGRNSALPRAARRWMYGGGLWHTPTCITYSHGRYE
jgi:hypothetical protein